MRGYFALGALAAAFSQANAFGIFTLTAGRADYANRYDVTGQLMYPGQGAGGSPAAVYNFGKWADFASRPPNVTAAMVTNALTTSGNAWSRWAKVSFDNSGLNATGTGLIRLRYDSTRASGASAYAYADPADATRVGYAEIVFGRRPAPGIDWDATNFAWTTKHEMGHILGLIDLYENLTEDFADRPVGSVNNPDLTYSQFQDNVMYQINPGNHYDRPPTTDIDNDEIFGVSMLWGSNTSQIFTGDLADAFNANGRRGIKAAHGQQNGGWWTYRGTFGSTRNLVTKPYIDLDFAGFTGDWNGQCLGPGGAHFTYAGNQGGSIERFMVDTADFQGNFILKLKSRFMTERYIDADVVVGGVGTSFTLTPNKNGLTYSSNIAGGQFFAQVMGPVPEPSTLGAVGLGLAGLACLRRNRKR